MRRFLTPAVFICFFTLLSGCFDYYYPDLVVSPPPSPSPAPIILPDPAPRALTFGIAFSPSDAFDPLTDTLRYNSHAARLCYEGLFELDDCFVPQPLLCTFIETVDRMSFTLTLREDVLFHDGYPLTAGDVVYSVKQAQRPGGPYSARLSCISSVTAGADGTVLITMSVPVWNAAALLDFPIVRESAAPVAPGTGPYRMTLSSEGGYLLPSNIWWQEKALPAGRIELVDAANADTLVYSFQYEYISMHPADFWDTFSPGIHAGYDKMVTPSGLVQYIGFNTRKAPLDRYDLRLALTLALDRQKAVSSVYGEDAETAALPIPPSSPFYSQTAASCYLFDPEEAEALLAGRTPALDFIVGAENAARVRMAESCAEMLRDAGFDVTVRTLGYLDFETALLNGDFDMYYAEARPAPNFDPREFLLPGGAFAYGVSDSSAMRSALDLLAASDPVSGEGSAALGGTWEVLYDELPMITVCFRNTLFISQRGLLSGQTPTFYNPYRNFADWTVHER